MLPDNWHKQMVLGIIRDNYKAVLIGIVVGYIVSILLHLGWLWLDNDWFSIKWHLEYHPEEILIPGYFGGLCLIAGAIIGWFRDEVWEILRDMWYS